MTHDGRTHERKKLTLEEVNQIKPEVSKEVNQVKIMNVHEYASNWCPLCLTKLLEMTIYERFIQLEKKTRTVLNDWQEANGEVKLLEEVCDDILKYGLLETPDHQKLMIKQMIDHVLEKDEQSRLAMGKFFNIMADKLSGLHFEEP